jgi:hypothetical protein
MKSLQALGTASKIWSSAATPHARSFAAQDAQACAVRAALRDSLYAVDLPILSICPSVLGT